MRGTRNAVGGNSSGVQIPLPPPMTPIGPSFEGLALGFGGMAERSKAAVLKIARPRKGSHGFESHSLRSYRRPEPLGAWSTPNHGPELNEAGSSARPQ